VPNNPRIANVAKQPRQSNGPAIPPIKALRLPPPGTPGTGADRG